MQQKSPSWVRISILLEVAIQISLLPRTSKVPRDVDTVMDSNPWSHKNKVKLGLGWALRFTLGSQEV